MVIDLDIAYAPSLPPSVRDELEDAARTTGLALGRLELLGQDLETALQFIEAVHAGLDDAFLDDVDWDRLETTYRRRKRAIQAPRIRERG